VIIRKINNMDLNAEHAEHRFISVFVGVLAFSNLLRLEFVVGSNFEAKPIVGKFGSVNQK